MSELDETVDDTLDDLLVSEVPVEVRDRLCLALDTDDLVEAKRWAHLVEPWFGVVKVGPELYLSSGPDAVATFTAMGLKVCVDLKLHDIPSTVYRSARMLGSLGIDYLTLHAHGGVEMMHRGVEGALAGAEAAGTRAPRTLAVTLLSSDATAPEHIHPARTAMAVEAGVSGLMCTVDGIASARSVKEDLVIAATAIRAAGQDPHDHTRVATPDAALAAGADLLVIGRSVLSSDDPQRVAEGLVDAVLS